MLPHRKGGGLFAEGAGEGRRRQGMTAALERSLASSGRAGTFGRRKSRTLQRDYLRRSWRVFLPLYVALVACCAVPALFIGPNLPGTTGRARRRGWCRSDRCACDHPDRDCSHHGRRACRAVDRTRAPRPAQSRLPARQPCQRRQSGRRRSRPRWTQRTVRLEAKWSAEPFKLGQLRRKQHHVQKLQERVRAASGEHTPSGARRR